MLQYYKMLFWRMPESQNTSFDKIAQKAYEAVRSFQKLPEKYRPTLPVGTSKKDTIFEELTYEKFYNELKKNVNQENGMVHEDLGYQINLFTSFDSLSSCSFSLQVGNTNKMFINSIVVKLAINLDYFNPETSNLLSEIFAEVVQAFEPFWACAVNSLLPIEEDYLTEHDKTPTALHWLNYFSLEMVENLGGEKKFKKLQKKYKTINFKNGILRLQDIALDANKSEDVKLKADIERELL